MSETIVRIAARGDGVSDAGHYFPGVAPGDVVAPDGTITPGPHRVVPPCSHFGVCGGCQLQHIDDASYADFVIGRIAAALTEQGLQNPELTSVHISPPQTRRRASLRAERRGKQVILGFNEGASHAIVDLHECHILLPELFALVAPLRGLLGRLMPDRARATITLTRADQGIDMLLSGIDVDGLAAVEALNDFAIAYGLARVSVDDGNGPSARWCPEPPTVTLGSVPVALPDGAFLQATADGEAALIAAVSDGVGDATKIFDLFAGLGTFALSLPGRVKAIEGSRDAAMALLATHKVAVDHRDLFRRPLTEAELNTADAVVLDPPRAGAREQVARIAASTVPRVVYVSCNPATFARDARTLVDGGYSLERITPVGQFRWSTHVELTAVFSHGRETRR